jgi:two-component system sensor histidine kinase AlgZ
MHPVFTSHRRLALYLLAWIPDACLLAYLFTVAGGVSGRDGAVLAFPLILIYAFICLASWYPSRATPLETSGFMRIALTHLIGAIVATEFWVFSARILVRLLAGSDPSSPLLVRFPAELPVIVAMGIMLYLLSVAFYYVALALQASQQAQARLMEAHMLARDAELRALKAQVNPHFLFNSLNSISALAGSDPSKAREMCILLADFLRRTLGLGEKSAIPLEEELSLIHAFLAVEKVRFGDRVRMQENISPEVLTVRVPPLLLQPLVENAVVHGIANMVEGGDIRLRAGCEGDWVTIVVENTYDPEAPPRRRNGVGLANVRQRLEARYARKASFAVTTESNWFRVTLGLPKNAPNSKEEQP